MNRTFYIFRHGETDWNKEKRIQGHTDTLLNENGILQAQNLVSKFSSIPLEAIYSSDLIRAKTTATYITNQYNIPLNLSKDLREMGYGDAEGMKIDELKKVYGEDLWNKIHSFKLENNNVSFPNGETRLEARLRIRSVIDQIIQTTNLRVIGISTHGGALRNLLHGFLPNGHEVLPIPNCIVYKFDYIAETKEFIVDTNGF
jgi:broad specificity phosphatase PhoE